MNISDDALLDALLRPGTPAPARAELRANQIRKRLLQFVLLRKRLEREAPALLDTSGFSSAWDAMRSAPAPAFHAVVWYPSFGRWVAVAQRLLDRGAHLRLPDGQFPALVAHSTWFALATAIRGRATVALEVPVDHRGKIPLPSLNRRLDGPLDRAGDRVSIRVEEGELCLPPGFSGSVLPLLAGRIELNDFDSYLAYESDAQEFLRLDDTTTQEWMIVAEKAAALLQRVDAAMAAEVLDETSVLVPLLCPDQKTNVSSSSGDAYGMLQVSWHQRAEVIAEALVHEYHHTKLNAVLDIVQLVEDPVAACDLYSPWRDDARPAVGLLHGIWAFHSVVVFWDAVATAATDPIERSHALFEQARRTAQIRAAIAGLRGSGRLTEDGARVVDAAARSIDRMTAGSIEDTRAFDRRVTDELAGHALRWRVNHRPETPARTTVLLDAWSAAGGALRAPGGPDCLEAENPREAAIADQLDVSGGMHVNRVAHGLVALDPTLNALGQLRVRDPEAFARVAADIESALTDAGPLLRLFAGHAAYITGDFPAALGHYAACLTIQPANFDVWRAFAFACRHVGDRAASDGFLFHPLTVLQLAERIAPDGALLALLSGAECDVAGGVWRQLLRWVRGRDDLA